MWQLIAEGPKPQQRWKHRIDPGRRYVVGRSGDADLPVPWEAGLSRKHFTIEATPAGVRVEQLDSARNQLFVDGSPAQSLTADATSRIVVGETSFMFREAEFVTNSDDSPVQEISFSQQELQRVHFEDADRRLEALARLPASIGSGTSRQESHTALVSLILTGIRQAEAAAVVVRTHEGKMSVTSWDRRREVDGAFRPSQRLVKEALQEKRTILHLWESRSHRNESDESVDEYTVTAEFDWAFCTPVARNRNESWGIYVAGKLDHAWADVAPLRQNLQADVRFTQLVGEVISSAEKMNEMEGQLSVLRQFLSPPILSALESSGSSDGLNIGMLSPKVCDVTVVFCDLRGFSAKAEESADNLPELLSRVSAALEVMTHEILDHGGVTGDFLGDAVLGFWGWPFSSEDAPVKACRAALSIRKKFAEIHADKAHPLSDFRMGIGIAHGRAVAGKIGTSGRMTVTVFGPVVNLASRLEGMTKKLHAPIIIDEQTAEIAGARLSDSEGRVRRLARVLPYGMDNPLTISELIPSFGDHSELTDTHLTLFEEGVEHFTEGRWDEAYGALHKMPASDRAQDFLMALITQHDRKAPAGWSGVFEFPSK